MWSDLNWKSQWPCSWQKKNARQTYDSRLRLSIEEACRAFEKHLQEGNYDGGNWLHEADSPFEIQITFARYRSKSFLKPITLNGIVQSSWQMTLRWRCNYLNLWGQRDRWKMILQSKIQNNSSFRNRKTILTGGCCSENHSQSCHSPAINPSMKLILIWDFPFLM